MFSTLGLICLICFIQLHKEYNTTHKKIKKNNSNNNLKLQIKLKYKEKSEQGEVRSFFLKKANA